MTDNDYVACGYCSRKMPKVTGGVPVHGTFVFDGEDPNRVTNSAERVYKVHFTSRYLCPACGEIKDEVEVREVSAEWILNAIRLADIGSRPCSNN